MYIGCQPEKMSKVRRRGCGGSGKAKILEWLDHQDKISPALTTSLGRQVINTLMRRITDDEYDMNQSVKLDSQ